MKKVKLLRPALVDKTHHDEGDVVEVGDERAEKMVKIGQAEIVPNSTPVPDPAEVEGSPKSNPSKVVTPGKSKEAKAEEKAK
jgi:hypothetical protein